MQGWDWTDIQVTLDIAEKGVGRVADTDVEVERAMRLYVG